MCKVSVIVPSFNSAEYLPDLLTGLTGQTLKEIEILLVDDGSTDDTRRIVEGFAEKDPRVRYLHQENAGAGAARNNGLEHATGEYFICLDSDDLYDDTLLEKLYTAASENQADAVMCLFRRHNYWLDAETENEGYKPSILPQNQVFDPLSIPNYCAGFNPGPINKMFRRAMVMEHGLRYSTTYVANDVFFGYSALITAKRVYCLPDNLLTVRRYFNANSISSNRVAHLEDSLKAFRQLYAWMYENHLEEAYAEQLRQQLVSGFGYNSSYGWNEKFWALICQIVDERPWKEIPAAQIRSMFRCNASQLEKQHQHLDELKRKAAALPEGSRERTSAENEVTMYASRIDYCVKLGPYLSELAQKRGETPRPDGWLKRVLKKILPASRRTIAAQTTEIVELNKRQQRQLLALLRPASRQLNELPAQLEQITDAMNAQANAQNARLAALADAQNKQIEALTAQVAELHKQLKKIQEQTSRIQTRSLEILKTDKEGVWGQVFNQALPEGGWLQDRTFFPGRYAAGYNLLYVLYRCLDEFAPRSILDIGLGQTTKMISQYAAARPGVAHTVVENNGEWIDFYKNRFSLPANTHIHHLDVHLVPFAGAEQVRMYRGFAEALAGQKFGLICVDAPFGGDMKELSRADIVALLPGCLEKSFVIFLDDYHRKPEQNTAALIRQTLSDGGVEFAEGVYRSTADTLVFCSPDLKYFCTL